MRKLRAAFKMFLFLLNCIWVIPTQSLVLLITKGKHAYHLPWLWHYLVAKSFSIRYEIVGTPSRHPHTLFMSNHLSYLDIPMIGSVVKASFVAKSEVSGWAGFGYLCTLQQTAFLERKRTAIVRESETLNARINAGESLIIFPEATSTDGRAVVPFKTSLFQLALGPGKENLYIQPITLEILEVDGRSPDDQYVRELYAWPFEMEMEMPPHLWRFAQTSGVKMRMTFHEPIRAADYTDRKVLARDTHDKVSKGLTMALAA